MFCFQTYIFSTSYRAPSFPLTSGEAMRSKDRGLEFFMSWFMNGLLTTTRLLNLQKARSRYALFSLWSSVTFKHWLESFIRYKTKKGIILIRLWSVYRCFPVHCIRNSSGMNRCALNLVFDSWCQSADKFWRNLQKWINTYVFCCYPGMCLWLLEPVESVYTTSTTDICKQALTIESFRF